MPTIVFQLYAPQHSAVYSTKKEALKEFARDTKGFTMAMIELADNPINKWWIVGQAGPDADIRKTKIFTESGGDNGAEKYHASLTTYGYSNLVIKELKLITKGPELDTVEKLLSPDLELKFDKLLLDLETGLPVFNANGRASIRAEWYKDELQHGVAPGWRLRLDTSRYAIIDMHAPSWASIREPEKVVADIKTQASLLSAVLDVNPKDQPNKWKNTQSKIHWHITDLERRLGQPIPRFDISDEETDDNDGD